MVSRPHIFTPNLLCYVQILGSRCPFNDHSYTNPIRILVRSSDIALPFLHMRSKYMAKSQPYMMLACTKYYCYVYVLENLTTLSTHPVLIFYCQLVVCSLQQSHISISSTCEPVTNSSWSPTELRSIHVLVFTTVAADCTTLRTGLSCIHSLHL